MKQFKKIFLMQLLCAMGRLLYKLYKKLLGVQLTGSAVIVSCIDRDVPDTALPY